MRKLFHALIWILPASSFKNALLRLAGNEIGLRVSVGPCVVIGVRRAELGDDVTIRSGNVLRNLTMLRLDRSSAIGSWNWISAHPGFQELSPGAGTVQLGYGARIESRNYIDCSGTVEVGDYAAIGGNRCTVQSHEPDLRRMTQTAGRIVVGHHSMVGSNCVLLQGACLPPSSILAAHSTMTGKPLQDARPGVYAGSPAEFKRPVSGGYFDRTDVSMTKLEVVGHLGVRMDADMNDGA